MQPLLKIWSKWHFHINISNYNVEISTLAVLNVYRSLSPLWPSNAIWWHRSESTLAWRYQVITWTNLDISLASVVFTWEQFSRHEIVIKWNCKTSLKIKFLKLLPDHPGANELILHVLIYCEEMWKYCQTSNISHTLVDNKIGIVWASLVGAAPLHPNSRLNTWLQWIVQRQLQDKTSDKFCDLVPFILEV